MGLKEKLRVFLLGCFPFLSISHLAGYKGSEWGWGHRPAWIQADSTSMSSEMPCGASVSGASGPPGLAATGIIGAPRNLKWKNKPCQVTEIISMDEQRMRKQRPHREILRMNDKI